MMEPLKDRKLSRVIFESYHFMCKENELIIHISYAVTVIIVEL